MGTPKNLVEALEKHTAAVKDLELSEAAIKILEGMHSATAERCIGALKRGQQTTIRQLDKAALQLGLPHPHSTVQRCNCGKIKSVDLLSPGHNHAGKKVWFCDKCIPL
jgi:hypothetical protein